MERSSNGMRKNRAAILFSSAVKRFSFQKVDDLQAEWAQ
jgi:hypothetical protein